MLLLFFLPSHSVEHATKCVAFSTLFKCLKSRRILIDMSLGR